MGPLAGIRIIELAGIGPAPFAAMMLADLGADVIRVARPGEAVRPWEPLLRGRPSITADLRSPAGLATVMTLVAKADALVEGYRPGVAERLGIGPDACAAVNPRLVYGRMTGWGQDGPLAMRAGHDINYLSVTGALHAIGEPGRKPVPPINLVADFGGGAMFLVAGVLAALMERAGSGLGQVVDAAMVDGASALMSMSYAYFAGGQWTDERGANLLDGGAPFYDTYRCADGGYIAVGCLEPQFFAAFEAGLGVTLPPQHDTAQWPAMRAAIATTFASRSRDEWAAVFAGTDACATPVLSMSEAPAGAHLAARGTFVHDGVAVTPGPAPRFSRTQGGALTPPATPGPLDEQTLARWDLTAADLAEQ